MSHLVNLSSPEGEKLLNDCVLAKTGSVFQPLVYAVFNKQVQPASCGIQTCAVILSAHQLGKNNPPAPGATLPPIPKSEQPIIEENMFDHSGTSDVVSRAILTGAGTTLDQVADILQGHGRTVDRVFASDVDVNRFRDDAKKALSAVDSLSGVLVNYHMGTLGQGAVYGHHSPLAAYHADTDRFLIMDTWPETEVCWARAEDLYKAMNMIDADSAKSRGYCIVK